MSDALRRDGVPYECDLIMKGGISSGVVYPPAIVEIAKDHRLRSIGGSSAGAIAAVLAAAAELGRDSATGGFDELERIPDSLAEPDAQQRTRLFRLFQPQPETAQAYQLLWIGRQHRGTARVRAFEKHFRRQGAVPRVVAIVGALFVALAVALAAFAIVDSGVIGIVAASVVLILVLAVVLIAVWLSKVVTAVIRFAKTSPDAIGGNFQGLCNGRTGVEQEGPGLTDWLHARIQSLAGRDDPDVDPERKATPVTYGELAARGINLVTMTTNLTQGSGDVFPMPTGGWAFDPDDLAVLFPADVVEHLTEKGNEQSPGSADREAALREQNLVPLPAPSELPILLGARLSLSFPILISAVPLYAWLPTRAGDDWRMQYVKCWFSDGGITSNLPVHLFDSPLPRRPTYAINLSGGADTTLGPCDNVWRPLTAGRGPRASGPEITRPQQLLSAVLDTMQNWSDNSLAGAPGYRDRICTVRLDQTTEGGMNLDMGPTVINRLAERGGVAGANLAWMMRGTNDVCAAQPVMDPDKLEHQWDRHRFIRYRSFLGSLGTYLGRASEGYEAADYAQLARDAVAAAWLPYRKGWTDERRGAVDLELTDMFGLETTTIAEGAPAGIGLGFTPRETGEPTQPTVPGPLGRADGH